MTNADIVDALELTARLLELHGADPFRTRAFQTAAFNLDKSAADLAGLPVAELTKLPGVGRTVANRIRELAESGHMAELDELLAQTPEGVLAMFRIKGLGVKKIKTLWQELGIDTLAELRAAAERGDVARIKGFGEKMQAQILESLDFLQSQSGKVRMDKAAQLAGLLLDELSRHYGRVAVSGQVRRQALEVDTIQLLIESDNVVDDRARLAQLPNLHENVVASGPFAWRGHLTGHDVAVELLFYPRETFDRQLFIRTATEAHLAQTGPDGRTLLQTALTQAAPTEAAVYARAGLPYIVPEMREDDWAFAWAGQHQNDELITWEALRGTLHNHSTWSDGRNTLREMADHARQLGLQYFGIADHSQTATYAQGLSPGRVRQQIEEIDALNAEHDPTTFRIFKGIESDILGDGSLDYDPDTLALFDYVVASVHQTLNMSQERATARLIRAIENPFTTILGHPTGRLLLARTGYPIDHRAVIDACAEHNVVIEINASPYRLDIDWRWIDYCMERGVRLSINPDAHSTAGLHDMHWGVAVARKGGLTTAMTFNALPLPEMTTYLQTRKAHLG